MTDSEQEPNLADVLLDKELISLAQLELAIADQAINDIPLEEILLVRGWITEHKLYEVAPWLKPGAAKAPAAAVITGASSKPAAKSADNDAVARALSKASQSFQKPGEKNEKEAEPAKPKPTDIPKEPPVRPAGEPAVIMSPVQTDNDQNLKAYKEVLKKILAMD